MPACCTLGSDRIVHFFYRTSPGINQPLLLVGMSENTHKTMPYSRRDAQDTEITLKFAADATSEHPYASAAHACTYVSGCVSKARTAFPVAPLARVGGGCIELDGPAIISGGCLSVSATRDTTGVSRARDVRKRAPRCNFASKLNRERLGATCSNFTVALSGIWGVRP